MGLYTLLGYVWHTVNAGQDPAPSLFDSRSDARHYACERLPVNVAAERHRGTIPPVDPRGDWIERDSNIVRDRPDTSPLAFWPEARHLVDQLVRHDAGARPGAAEAVLQRVKARAAEEDAKERRGPGGVRHHNEARARDAPVDTRL